LLPFRHMFNCGEECCPTVVRLSSQQLERNPIVVVSALGDTTDRLLGILTIEATHSRLEKFFHVFDVALPSRLQDKRGLLNKA
jgi:aspartokinase